MPACDSGCWVRLADSHALTITLIPLSLPPDEPLVGFHLARLISEESSTSVWFRETRIVVLMWNIVI